VNDISTSKSRCNRQEHQAYNKLTKLMSGLGSSEDMKIKKTTHSSRIRSKKVSQYWINQIAIHLCVPQS